MFRQYDRAMAGDAYAGMQLWNRIDGPVPKVIEGNLSIGDMMDRAYEYIDSIDPNGE